jgi:hypothetical protein
MYITEPLQGHNHKFNDMCCCEQGWRVNYISSYLPCQVSIFSVHFCAGNLTCIIISKVKKQQLT